MKNFLLSNRQIDANGCWVWTKNKDSDGYGRFPLNDGTTTSAHRAAYETWVGEIPAGLTIDHLCRNRACFNPDHLEPVTVKENILRGNGLGARNARKTHCPQGHPYEGTNLVVRPNGQRRCRECTNEAAREYQRQKHGYSPREKVSS